MFLKVTLKWVIFFFVLVGGQLHPPAPAEYKQLPSLREQAEILNGWTSERIARIPLLLRKYDVDAWLMCQREHAEDTIWWSIKNATAYDVHRRTVVLFHTNTSSLQGQPNPLVWIDNTGQVWTDLHKRLASYDPKRITVNVDQNIAFSGGMHVGEMRVLEEELGSKWMSRMVNVPMLAIEYVSYKVSGQIQYYRDMQEVVWAMLEEGFSYKIIDPGVTSTTDLEWWFREKMLTLNVTTWNHPRIFVTTPASFPGWSGSDDIIKEGDLLHIDFGVTAMGMNTDTQHLAYVPRTSKGETDAPEGLKAGLKKGNRMQDIVLENMKAGLTGDEVLQRCLEQMKLENIEGQIYSHPIGDWGHDAGAVMGFTNFPEHVPVLGELPILPNTYYSIELFATHFVPERNETLRFLLEENAYWNAGTETWQFVRGAVYIEKYFPKYIK
ncbi:hypothetical protein IW261DRAFT_1620053 [Armillaria novae-zelandiae]|uniref:Peptidase M24 domain-containing protein n=1 Tax=Armillaria novae-zelandiae TaxID=153914 RepID=A0AA39PV20_9AGAR|nr:hypothetical protein IW261DRAFT_1620053 [Armillaria novae-zelandiae]